jgi:hypothetical protein
MKKIARLLLAMIAAWLGGLIVIFTLLYFANGGADFTREDVMGFSVLFVVASTLLMLGVYLPALFWLRRRSNNRLLFPVSAGLLLNLPIYILLLVLSGRKVSSTEAIGFMLTFLVAGLLFGFVFGSAFPRRQQ